MVCINCAFPFTVTGKRKEKTRIELNWKPRGGKGRSRHATLIRKGSIPNPPNAASPSIVIYFFLKSRAHAIQYTAYIDIHYRAFLVIDPRRTSRASTRVIPYTYHGAEHGAGGCAADWRDEARGLAISRRFRCFVRWRRWIWGSFFGRLAGLGARDAHEVSAVAVHASGSLGRVVIRGRRGVF